MNARPYFSENLSLPRSIPLGKRAQLTHRPAIGLEQLMYTGVFFLIWWLKVKVVEILCTREYTFLSKGAVFALVGNN